MPLPNVHSVSAAVAGIVIAGYWLVFVAFVLQTYSAYPSASVAPSGAAARQACGDEGPDGRLMYHGAGSCGPTGVGVLEWHGAL